LRQVMQNRLPRAMWPAYVEACVALAEGLRSSTSRALSESLTHLDESEKEPRKDDERPLGFRP
jgi:hypothetical protein